MVLDMQNHSLVTYVRSHVRFGDIKSGQEIRSETLNRIEKTFLLLPDDALEAFLSGERNLTILIVPDLDIPYGMATTSTGPPAARKYTITAHAENLEWPEDLFIGALLRELAHVVARRPPENEWPQARGDRARYKERLEYVADAMVWRWGLRHYSIRHLTATYPEHWVERIIEEIEKVVLEDKERY
ncbi:MAG TPA: hypothetical protein VK463_19490 [Desulfomonilaceae bacterium]|nr:hypothetical protein [Desulfomonilaceae bacterium]